MLQHTGETQSARPSTSDTPSFNTQDSLRVPTPFPMPSASTKSRRSSKLAEAREHARADARADARDDNSPNCISQDDSRVTERIDRETTAQTPPALAASSMNAQPRNKIKRSDAIAWSEPDDSPAVPTSRKQTCGTCSKQKSNLGRLCIACLTTKSIVPPPKMKDEEEKGGGERKSKL